jgi:hypothetical protein
MKHPITPAQFSLASRFSQDSRASRGWVIVWVVIVACSVFLSEEQHSKNGEHILVNSAHGGHEKDAQFA